jgi:hypothetical protein
MTIVLLFSNEMPAASERAKFRTLKHSRQRTHALQFYTSISIQMGVYVCVCPHITLERLERFQPNLVHILLYVCVRILRMYYIYSARRMVWEAGNLDDSHC